MSTSFHFSQWLDHHLYRPDLDSETLMRKRMTWIWTVSVSFGVLLMTLLSWGLEKEFTDLRTGMAIARVVRLLSNDHVQRMYLSTFSGAVVTGFAAFWF